MNRPQLAALCILSLHIREGEKQPRGTGSGAHLPAESLGPCPGGLTGQLLNGPWLLPIHLSNVLGSGNRPGRPEGRELCDMKSPTSKLTRSLALDSEHFVFQNLLLFAVE